MPATNIPVLAVQGQSLKYSVRVTHQNSKELALSAVSAVPGISLSLLIGKWLESQHFCFIFQLF